MKNKLIKIFFVILSIALVIPSLIYIIKNGTVSGFDTYFNFFIGDTINKKISTIVYLILFISITILYFRIIKKDFIFKDIKGVLKYVTLAGSVFVIMLPWTSSDIFYYMGVGELNSVYKQNPYYISMQEYSMNEPQAIENDEIFKQRSK